MTNTTVKITPDMQKLLAGLKPETRALVRVLPTTYTCNCGKSTFNDAEIMLAGKMQKMTRIHECNRCNVRAKDPAQVRAEQLDRWAFCKVDEMCKTKRGLYIHGGFGTGKTHTAKRLHLAAHRANVVARFTTPQGIQGAFNDCITSEIREAQVLSEFGTMQLLIIDDIGQEQVTERGLSQLWQVINRRYEMHRPCVYTSNYTLGELTARYAAVNSVQAESICSRIAGSCEQHAMEGADRRLSA